MFMDEYVEYYIENLLRIQEVSGMRIVVNNLLSIDYETAVSYVNNIVNGNNEKLTMEQFINNENIKKYKGDLDSHKLWVLSVLLYNMIAKHLVAEVSLNALDEYMELHNCFLKGLDVSSIEIRGTFEGKRKHFTITDERVLAKMLVGYLDADDSIFTRDDFTLHIVNRITTIDKLVNKRTLDYGLAKELELFIKSYTGRFTDKEKYLILEILFMFGRFKDSAVTTDNYRTLMSDAEELQAHEHLLIVDGKLMPFTMIWNPKIQKIRQEYRELMDDDTVKYKKSF